MNDHARRVVTETCLIAADVDRTILSYIESHAEERKAFLMQVAPELLRAAGFGTHVAFVTGNSMHELASRILNWLVNSMCEAGSLDLFERFHFFSNSGGVYFRIPADALRLQRPVAESREVLRRIVRRVRATGELYINPEFLDGAYLESCRIDPDDVGHIERIASELASDYSAELRANRKECERDYDLTRFSRGPSLPKPTPDMRMVRYGQAGSVAQASVQITLKPVLSSYFARSQANLSETTTDPRARLCARLQTALDQSGLSRYRASPGGRTSIDITLECLDKAYALEFLIDRLRLQGNTRRGQQFGSNAIYLGDEVLVGGGNDYSVTRIPGLMVFAVGGDDERIPFRSTVMVASDIFTGPDATRKILARFNEVAAELIAGLRPGTVEPRTAVEALKAEIFERRVQEKLSELKRGGIVSAEEWGVLHALVTLVNRRDLASRHWVTLLGDHLDAIMNHLFRFRGENLPMHLGGSHPEYWPGRRSTGARTDRG